MANALLPEVEESLVQLLDCESEALAQFVKALEDEITILSVGDAESARQCAQRKQSLMNQIFAASDAVNIAARRASRNPNLKATATWLAQSGSPRIRSAYDRLAERASEARDLNNVSSRIMKAKLRQIDERLNILMPDGRVNAVYYPTGYAVGQMGQKRMVTSA